MRVGSVVGMDVLYPLCFHSRCDSHNFREQDQARKKKLGEEALPMSIRLKVEIYREGLIAISR